MCFLFFQLYSPIWSRVVQPGLLHVPRQSFYEQRNLPFPFCVLINNKDEWMAWLFVIQFRYVEQKPTWCMASGCVVCQRVTMLGRAVVLGAYSPSLDNPNFHYIAKNTNNAPSRELCWPFNCSKGSQVWCEQSFFAWVLRGKPSCDVIVQKSPHHFWEKQWLYGLLDKPTYSVKLWLPSATQCSASSYTAPGTVHRLWAPFSRRLNTRGQLTMILDVVRHVGTQSLLHHFFTSLGKSL